MTEEDKKEIKYQLANNGLPYVFELVTAYETVISNLGKVLNDSLVSNRILEEKIIEVEFKNEGLDEDIRSLKKQLEEANHILIELEARSECINKDEIKEYLDDYLI